jgi:hypothetical protein
MLKQYMITICNFSKVKSLVKFCIKYVKDINGSNWLQYTKNKTIIVERISLMPFGRMFGGLDVRAADLSQRHKSDDFDSFLMHLFF